MNVTVFPEQDGFIEGEIEMLTGKLGLTVMVIAFEVAGLFEMHEVNDEERTQVTTSLFDGMYMNVLELVPELTPFIFHWYEGVGPPFVGTAVKVTDVPAQTSF